jgi:hypothetical protein
MGEWSYSSTNNLNLNHICLRTAPEGNNLDSSHCKNLTSHTHTQRTLFLIPFLDYENEAKSIPYGRNVKTL